MDERDYKALNDSLKETTDKIPTAEEFLTDPKNYKKGIVVLMQEYALLHLTKQAEVITEKAKVIDFSIKGMPTVVKIVDKQSILQASEEYKQTIK
jgi:hypothetical protein